MQNILLKLRTDLRGFFIRSLYKTVIGPLKYRTDSGYNAAQYWQDRFARHGLTLKASGDEGLSEIQNQHMYSEAATVFTELCHQTGVDFQNSRVLEVGCGTGFYTQLLYNLKVRFYTGVDITDVLFPTLQNSFPRFNFVKKDVTVSKLTGPYDLIVMIDVIEHIVNQPQLAFAMQNISNCLAPDGLLFLAPVSQKSKKHLFYVHTWALDDIQKELTNCDLVHLVPFRQDYLLVSRKRTPNPN